MCSLVYVFPVQPVRLIVLRHGDNLMEKRNVSDKFHLKKEKKKVITHFQMQKTAKPVTITSRDSPRKELSIIIMFCSENRKESECNLTDFQLSTLHFEIVQYTRKSP